MFQRVLLDFVLKTFGLGAENETRTRDPNLGKVVLYQLSYFRSLLDCECKGTTFFLFCNFFCNFFQKKLQIICLALLQLHLLTHRLFVYSPENLMYKRFG